MVLRRTFGLKREEVTGGWRKLHNEEVISYLQGIAQGYCAGLRVG
jgi:hypothetical protein